MASLIPGFEYDIFISYRQKDNKGDRWVSEFVEALKTELESTFKEDITVYFDINPHDGLLETHDVDASLKTKLKCLVCIPIVSRTYCDPKSFAWEHEFKIFVDLASQDQFGLKIKLPNGNVANRILPVRIHDLDAADINLFESASGGVLRSIDFVYKETGVNRQLRSKDDDIIKSPGQILYRDQINKVALAVKDIIESMRLRGASEKVSEIEIQAKKPVRIKEVNHEEPAIKEKAKTKVKISDIGVKTKEKKELKFSLKKPKLWVSGTLIILVLLISFIIIFNHRVKVRWAKEIALPEIEQLINRSEISAAFLLSQKAEKYISQEPKFKELSALITSELTILTDPPGADVYIREYSDTEGAWEKAGTTPVSNLKMPGSSFYLTSSFYLARIEKPGYENILAVTSTEKDTLNRKLFKIGTIPEDMVYVEGLNQEIKGDFNKEKHGFFLDRYEVTNKKYKGFVDNGGYRNPQYWKFRFTKSGKLLSWDEAMAEFTDKTGRPGPATWEAGDYPDGQENYPVSGISWYEAAAYAEYAGKSLPTTEHWRSGAGLSFQGIRFFSKIIPFSNFSSKRSDPAGKHQGVTWFGAYDMAGNVREWCWNESPVGHFICGGGWDDATYRYMDTSQLPSFDRSPENGFRCVKYIDKDKIPQSAFEPVNINIKRDYSREQPVPENTYRIYRNQFLYDSIDLKAVIETKDNSSEDWSGEKITFNAAYSKDRVIAYLYLPRNSSPPFQTLIYFPGTGAFYEKELNKSTETKWFIDYLLKSGRAVMCPVYKGTFERNDEPVAREGHQFTEWVIKWVKDFRRSVDYLETRPDIDNSKIAYYGHSWGGLMGGIIPAVENRLAVSVLILGGFPGRQPYPEADPINYVSRITMPVLMLNGRYDSNFPLEEAVRPFYKLLGTPEKNKRLVLYDTDHYVAKSDMVREVLDFLDKYLGPVNHLSEK